MQAYWSLGAIQVGNRHCKKSKIGQSHSAKFYYVCIQETFWINLEFRSKKIHTNFVTWRHKWVVELGPGEPVAIFGSPSSQTGAQNTLWWGWKLFCSRSGIFCLKVFNLWLLQDPEFALKTFLLTVSWWLWWTTFETLNKVERSEVHQVWNGSIQSSLRTNEISLHSFSFKGYSGFYA